MLGKLYLIAYNAALAAGWASIGVTVVRKYLDTESIDGLYASCADSLWLWQFVALLEVVHAGVGLVRSGEFTTFTQVYSRVHVLYLVWGIMGYVKYDPRAFAIMIFAWTVTEVVRYSFYLCNLLGYVPYPLLWCRYSFFYVLYPMGVSGELWHLVPATSAIFDKQEGPVVTVGDVSVPLLGVFSSVILLAYIPVFPMLFNLIRSQRRKAINPKSKSKKN